MWDREPPRAGNAHLSPPRFVSLPRSAVLTLEAIEARHADKPRRPRLSKRAKRFINEAAEESTEQWLDAHDKRARGKFTVKQRRRMRAFFDQLDDDASGSISVEELLGPLLAFGLASSEADVVRFVREVDADASGKIDFSEFIRALEAAHAKSDH